MALLKKDLDKRRKFILPYIRGKKVLDLGPGDISDRFLHKFVVKHAKSTVGLELFKKRADQLNKVGYNIKVGNAQDYNLKEKFDVIIAGDLIEHLTNFEGFLESTKKHMNKDSRLILNTPNAFSFWTLSGIIRKPFKEHTCWFCKSCFFYFNHNIIWKTCFFKTKYWFWYIFTN